MILETLRAHLLVSADVTGAFAQRIYPNVAPQGKEPNAVAVLSLPSNVPVNSLGGYSGLRNYRLQVDVYHRGYLAADEAATFVEERMRVGHSAFSSLLLARRPLYDDATERHRVSMDFSIWSSS